MTCTSGKGSMIDYVLVTTSFAAAIVSVEAVTEVPWGPHFGLRAKYRTNTADIMVPEIVRPMSVAKAVEEMEEKGWVGENPEGQPSISWEEARSMTQEMVEDCLSYPNGAVTEYTDMLEITEQTKKATRQYAEWSAATEIRHYSSLGVRVENMTKKDMRKYCGRGMPWRTKMVKVGSGARKGASKTRHGGSGRTTPLRAISSAL